MRKDNFLNYRYTAEYIRNAIHLSMKPIGYDTEIIADGIILTEQRQDCGLNIFDN